MDNLLVNWSNLLVRYICLAIYVVLACQWAFSQQAKLSDVRLVAATVVIVTTPGLIVFYTTGATTVAPPAQVAASQSTTPLTLPEGGSWKAAYDFVTKWEGRKCTEDGAHTFAGVTQGAFDRFNRRHGLPLSDVCNGGLTEAIKQGIFYEDYWLTSGADKLPPLVGIVHADFAYNVGAGRGGPAMNILAKCGSDLACYVQARYDWYRYQCRNCAPGHIRRTDDIVKLVNRLMSGG